jgi:hypothetical protein
MCFFSQSDSTHFSNLQRQECTSGPDTWGHARSRGGRSGFTRSQIQLERLGTPWAAKNCLLEPTSTGPVISNCVRCQFHGKKGEFVGQRFLDSEGSR